MRHIVQIGGGLLAVAMLIACGVVHGRVTHRWGAPERAIRAAERLNTVNRIVGAWIGEDLELGRVQKKQLTTAESIGQMWRTYKNEENQQQVDVLILCGRPGPISLHSPTICFRLAGMQQEQLEKSLTFTPAGGGRESQMWHAIFHPPATKESDSLRTLWAWSADGVTWETPNDPRTHYAGRDYLYKIYITSAVPPLTKTDNSSVPEDLKKFVEQLLLHTSSALAETK